MLARAVEGIQGRWKGGREEKRGGIVRDGHRLVCSV